MKTVKEIFETYQNGDHLTTEELEVLRHEMSAVATSTRNFGEIFRLTNVYAAYR